MLLYEASRTLPLTAVPDVSESRSSKIESLCVDDYRSRFTQLSSSVPTASIAHCALHRTYHSVANRSIPNLTSRYRLDRRSVLVISRIRDTS